jgi:uncharacterized membrane protein YphA (DoxX/SURF4 family)
MTIWLRIFHWFCRLLLAGIFIYTGYVKTDLLHLNNDIPINTLKFSQAIEAYKLVPDKLAWPLAKYLPIFEMALGIWILSGWKIRRSAAAAAALLVFFIAVLAITYARGIEADCGCGLGEERISPKAIARDSLFVFPAVFLIMESRLRSRFSKTVSVSE